VGKRIGEWVYELFITTLDADGFLVEDILDLYHGRGAFEAVLADEDLEEDPDRWCSYTECGQELWQIVCQWVWNLRLTLGKTMQKAELREIEWAPAKESPPVLLPVEDPPEEYGPWQWAAAFGRATGRFGADAFVGAVRMGSCAVQRGQASGEAKSARKMLSPNGLSTSLIRPIVSTVLSENSVWRKVPKVIVLVGSAQFVISCLHLPWLSLSESLSYSARYDGWMWQAERFAALGWSTGAGNTWR